MVPGDDGGYINTIRLLWCAVLLLCVTSAHMVARRAASRQLHATSLVQRRQIAPLAVCPRTRGPCCNDPTLLVMAPAGTIVTRRAFPLASHAIVVTITHSATSVRSQRDGRILLWILRP
jgi:hypothetical protein